MRTKSYEHILKNPIRLSIEETPQTVNKPKWPLPIDLPLTVSIQAFNTHSDITVPNTGKNVTINHLEELHVNIYCDMPVVVLNKSMPDNPDFTSFLSCFIFD